MYGNKAVASELIGQFHWISFFQCLVNQEPPLEVSKLVGEDINQGSKLKYGASCKVRTNIFVWK